jgi:hypothetical protein
MLTFCYQRDSRSFGRWLGGYSLPAVSSDSEHEWFDDSRSTALDPMSTKLETQKSRYWFPEDRSYRGKSMTIRSWRKPKCAGGSHKRVTVIAKLSRRLAPPKHIVTGQTIR